MNTLQHTLLLSSCLFDFYRKIVLFTYSVYIFIFYFSNYLSSDLLYRHVDVWRAKYCQERIKLSTLGIVLFQLRKTEIFQAPVDYQLRVKFHYIFFSCFS